MNFYNNIEKFNGFAGPRGGIATTYYGPSSSSSSSNKTEIDKEYERLFGSNSTTSSGPYSSRSGSSSYSGQPQSSPKSSETTEINIKKILPFVAIAAGLVLAASVFK